MQKPLRNAAEQHPGNAAVTPSSHDDQISVGLFGDVRDEIRRIGVESADHMETRRDARLDEIVDLRDELALKVFLVRRTSGAPPARPPRRSFAYTTRSLPLASAVSSRAVERARSAASDPSVAQIIVLNMTISFLVALLIRFQSPADARACHRWPARSLLRRSTERRVSLAHPVRRQKAAVLPSAAREKIFLRQASVLPTARGAGASGHVSRGSTETTPGTR